MTPTPDRSLQDIGRNAYESIVEMVAALDVDYDRIEELRGRYSDNDKENDLDEDEKLELHELMEQAGDCTSREDAERRIQEDALSVEVRSGWVEVGGEMTAEEFCILITTGGPAIRIRGELGEFSTPKRAWLEVQDWGTPWTEHHGHTVGDTEWESVDQDVLLAYCQQFYFGE